MRWSARFLARSAGIAALYAVLSFALAPISFGVSQIRVSEALCVLPVFLPEAVPGLTLGCAISNLIGVSMGLSVPVDLLVGTAATLAAALLTRVLRNRPFWIAVLPPILLNALAIGLEMTLCFGQPLWFSVGSVGLGQILSCLGLGGLVYSLLRKYKNRLSSVLNDKL